MTRTLSASPTEGDCQERLRDALRSPYPQNDFSGSLWLYTYAWMLAQAEPSLEAALLDRADAICREYAKGESRLYAKRSRTVALTLATRFLPLVTGMIGKKSRLAGLQLPTTYDALGQAAALVRQEIAAHELAAGDRRAANREQTRLLGILLRLHDLLVQSEVQSFTLSEFFLCLSLMAPLLPQVWSEALLLLDELTTLSE